MWPGLVSRSQIARDRAGSALLLTPDWKPQHSCQHRNLCWQVQCTAGLQPHPGSRVIPKKVQMRTQHNGQRGEPFIQLHVFNFQNSLFPSEAALPPFFDVQFPFLFLVPIKYHGGASYMCPSIILNSEACQLIQCGSNVFSRKTTIPLLVQELTISVYLAPCSERPFQNQLCSWPQWHPVSGSCFESRYSLCTFAKIKTDCAVQSSIQNT